ncbi:diacylglycerol kinase family lipid kinase [Patescibacteria group bacterium]|nr:diacylglycerol kinase family lipid kinase [Patescibacteria group bacterium]
MTKEEKLFIIFNPAANRGGAAAQIPKLEALLNSRKIEYQLAITKQPLHATQLAEQAAQAGYPLVVAAGGDGTINEVVNGLAGTETTMGILPYGSGNDFAKMFYLRKSDMEYNLDLILKGESKRIDLGLMNGRYFAASVSMGFTGRVSNYVKQSPDFLRGYAMYLFGVGKILINYYTHNFTITAKDAKGKEQKFLGDFTLCRVGNSKTEGNGFNLTPNAKLDDQLFDVCLVDGVSRGYVLKMLPKVMQGTHVNEPPVTIFRASQIEVVSDLPIPLHIDGEPNIKYKKVDIKIVPRSLKVAYS